MRTVVFRYSPASYLNPVDVAVMPLRRWTDQNHTVHLPSPKRLTGTSSPLHLEMEPLGARGAWKVQESPSMGGHTRYVIVPPGDGLIEFSDLVDVNPDSLDPTSAPEAAWWIAFNELSERVGSAGPSGGGFTFVSEGSSVWAISHTLGYRPGGITVIDTDGVQHDPEVTYLNSSTVVLTFGYPVSGTAYLS